MQLCGSQPTEVPFRNYRLTKKKLKQSFKERYSIRLADKLIQLFEFNGQSMDFLQFFSNVENTFIKATNFKTV